MKCDCKDWEENIDLVNSGFTFMQVHGCGSYSGKTFNYCPWCSKKLTQKEEK